MPVPTDRWECVVSRVHDSEVEQVTGRSVGLAWWSADAESDS